MGKKQELIREIEYKYDYCAQYEEELENADSEDYNALANENLETAFLQMDKLDDMTEDELDEMHEDLMVTFCHLEDLGC